MSETENIYCPHCKQTKPASEFGKNSTHKNGKQTYCKKCMNEIMNKNKKRKEAGEILPVGRPSSFSEETIEEMKQYRSAGFSYKEIAEYVGAKESTVRMFFTKKCSVEERTPTPKKDILPQYQAIISNHTNNTPMPPKTNNPVKASLSDFQPRDLIKHLYNLGYRIENNQLIFKQTVNLKDIINA